MLASDSAAAKPMLILIAGPYRSGTNEGPLLLRKNVEAMESYAVAIFRAGHIPMVGEWLALPLVALAGSQKIGDAPFNEIFHPVAIRPLENATPCSASAALRWAPTKWSASHAPWVSPSTPGSTKSQV